MSVKIIERIRGQEQVKAQLRQALEKDRLPHALLFSGPSGVGKKEMAWALAQQLLCDQEGLCGSCYNCLSTSKKENENVLCVTHETLQIRLKDVKEIPAFLSLQSFSKAKVILMDSAEKLNLQAGNFLLKIIEEPPPKSFFFLISSEPSKLPLTIRSRFQQIRFQALSEELIKELAPLGTPAWMIRGSRGQLDKIEELSEQKEIRSHSFHLWSKLFTSDFSDLEISKQISNRKSALLLCHFWQEILRDARFFKSGCYEELIHRDQKADIQKMSLWPKSFLDLLIKKTIEMSADLQANADYNLCFENFSIFFKRSLKCRGLA